MLGYQVHDVHVRAELRELAPVDGWTRWERTGYAHLDCACGYTDGPMLAALVPLMAKLHIHGSA
ncbi:hypothetical protein ACWD6O_13795 [Streptomyces californicus]